MLDKKGDIVALHRHHSYYMQVQGQMFIWEKPFCDFVVWTSEGIHIERIPYDPTVITVSLPNFLDFFVMC